MKQLTYLYFPGCKLMPFLPEYDRFTRSILAHLEIRLVDSELNCCGYPARHLDFTAAMLAGARILAVAAEKGLPVLTPCKCCYGNLKQADFWMRNNTALRQRINDLLAREGLRWKQNITVRHLLNALSEDVGLTRMAEKVTQRIKGVKIAVHYGCHALRPGDVTRFDNPLAPTIFEKIARISGAEIVEWPLRLECCGAPLWEKNKKLSLSLMQRKLADAHAAGAQILLTACTYCQLQFDQVRREHLAGEIAFEKMPAVLISQLLAAAFGLEAGENGLRI